jgi:predicted TIM-barrel fold metal-dependent hydrolase
VAAFAARMTRGPGAANQAGMTMKRSDKSDKDRSIGANAVFGRPGYSDPVERLRDMDDDGVDVEVLYSEVSAFRYIPDLATGASEATRAFNDVLAEFSSVDPYRLCVSYQIPIHNIEFAVAEVKRVAGLGGKSLQLPVFPAEFGLPDYYDDRYQPLFAAIQDTGLPICCHIGLNTMLEGLSLRDPTPQKAIMVSMTPLTTAEAFGMWIMGGVFERFPKLKLVFVEPGLAWVAAHRGRHGPAPGVRVPGHHRPTQHLLPSQREPDLHRGGLLTRSASGPYRCPQHLVVDRLSPSGDLMAPVAQGGRRAVRHGQRRRPSAHPVGQRAANLESVVPPVRTGARGGTRRSEREVGA